MGSSRSKPNAGTRRASSRPTTTRGTASGGEPETGKAGFELARDVLGSRVQDVDVDVLDLSAQKIGTFDVVLFLGVLYHVPNPLLALERVASVTGDLLILETVVDMVGVRRPAAAFYPGRELNDDPTNWWGPNHAAVEGMLRSRRVRSREIRRADPIRGLSRRARGLSLAQREERSRLRLPARPRGLSCVQAARRGRYVAHDSVELM